MLKTCLSLIAALFLLTACGSGGNNPSSSSTNSSSSANAYTRQLRGAVINPPRELTNFSIMSTTGEEFTLSEHRGELTLLYFGYRACPDFCPTTFAELKRVYTELGEPDNLNVAFITVDPERDTIENLALYTAAFHPDFIGLRAEGEELQAIEDQFGIVAQRRSVGESALSYLYDHTATLFLIGANGTVEVEYLYGTPYEDIIHDVRLILESL